MLFSSSMVQWCCLLLCFVCTACLLRLSSPLFDVAMPFVFCWTFVVATFDDRVSTLHVGDGGSCDVAWEQFVAICAGVSVVLGE